MKKALLYGLVLGVFFFSGCVEQAQDGEKTLTAWHWMTDRDEAFQELAKQYEEQTGIKVNFELFAPSDIYTQKVRAAAQGMNLPDIYGILAEKRDFSSFIKAGHVLELTPYMEEAEYEWQKTFFPKALEVNRFEPDNSYGINPGIYGVPLDVVTIQMVYNKKLFSELGLDPERPPQTFGELLDIGKKIKAAKMLGLVSGWGEIWMIDCFANNYAFNIMGRDKVLATIRGEVSYTDPDWVRVLELFQQMQEAGVLAGGLVTMINKVAEQHFANDRAVFGFNGSWCVNVFKGMNPGLEYGAMLPPKASDEYPRSIWGGAGSSFMVNARSRNIDEVIKFLKWLTGKDQQAFLAQATNNLPSNRESLSEISGMLQQFADDMDNTTHPNTWEISEFPAVIEAFDKGIQSIIIGEKTPQQVASEVQKIKERELSRRK
ncbi:ABC transporter substrate-binding protein [Candidatus Omnitrophota bacterium]